MTPAERERLEQIWARPENVKYGLYYYCRDDPRLIVPKRIKSLGWTINAAHPLGTPLLILILVFVLGPICLFLGLLCFSVCEGVLSQVAVHQQPPSPTYVSATPVVLRPLAAPPRPGDQVLVPIDTSCYHQLGTVESIADQRVVVLFGSGQRRNYLPLWLRQDMVQPGAVVEGQDLVNWRPARVLQRRDQTILLDFFDHQTWVTTGMVRVCSSPPL